MGTISSAFPELMGQRVYIDANIFIYFLNGKEPFLSTVAPFLEAVYKGEVIGYTGDAVLAEVMVHPYKQGNLATIERCNAFFSQKNFLTVLSHDSKAFDLAAKLSGTEGMKLVDSLHMATALQAGCAFMITQDKGMKSVDGIEIICLSLQA